MVTENKTQLDTLPIFSLRITSCNRWNTLDQKQDHSETEENHPESYFHYFYDTFPNRSAIWFLG